MISEPKVTVYCDEKDCDSSEEFGLTTTARGCDERNLKREIVAAGWLIIAENEHCCPECQTEREDD